MTLGRNIREESHEAGALDRGGECTLVLLPKAGALVAHHLTMRGDEHAQKLNVLVVNVLDVVGGQVVLLFLFHVCSNLYHSPK